VDLENLEVSPNLVLSRSDELRLRLTWVGILYGRIKADLAITGGVHTAEDAIKAMMVGARVAMMTSALLRNGIPHLRTVRDGILDWMEKHEYTSIRQMQGSMSQQNVADPKKFERANYMKLLGSWAPHL
jgi:dihydroorotate dehydrogenase (fumarate)